MVKITSREEAVEIYGERGGVAYDFVPMNWEGERIFMGEDVYVEKLPARYPITCWALSFNLLGGRALSFKG